MLEPLGIVYGNEELVREQELDDEAGLRFHQYSAALTKQLHESLADQLADAETEPNSGLEPLAGADLISSRKRGILHIPQTPFYGRNH